MLKTGALVSEGYREDDVQAFESLMRRYDKKVYNVALRMTRNPEEAKDLTQEAFIRAYRSFGTFRPGTHFERWLYRIVANLCIDQLRKRSRFRVDSLDQPIATMKGEMEIPLPDWAANPEVIAETHELHDRIQEALTRLPAEYRIAVVLCDIQGFSYEEIGQILKISIGTVRSRIHRGRRLLRTHLEPYLNLT